VNKKVAIALATAAMESTPIIKSFAQYTFRVSMSTSTGGGSFLRLLEALDEESPLLERFPRSIENADELATEPSTSFATSFG